MPLRLSLCLLLAVSVPSTFAAQAPGHTDITRWQGDKTGAVSLTFDDGIITQFTVARPILDSLDMQATFYVITGKIPGSFGGRFIGRNREDILREAAAVPTDSTTFFERASLIAFTGTSEAVDYHTRAGEAYEGGGKKQAYALMDEAYQKLLKGKLRDTDAVVFHDNAVDTTTWADLRQYQSDGHEIASHTVTHPKLAVLDEANLLYELEQSRDDIKRFLGPAATFSAEGPYGTEDERVMEYAHRVYPALRNRMPAPYLAELNRASRLAPGAQEREYVQWQRGPTDGTSLQTMKSWIDTTLAHDNVWLVEVFHGVDAYGWAARPGAELREYFTYIKEREDRLWIAPFATVTKYMREREATTVSSQYSEGTIKATLSGKLDPAVYNVPLTFKTYVPDGWQAATLRNVSGPSSERILSVETDENGSFVRYHLPPDTPGWLIRKSE
ncbi:polysaccharide deacetylase [Neolewinella xylanilytica]|uniref:Polysaccharide deacetylase n=1 Tax=Neolewinella xylanilytica TaxID=1514080 RepID=A0A2S6I9E9_9BACT|nr:polysaccharide deacetylase family protein [Neolewinella xylanilytica]PPK88126.1 polysaccharide deacetylase [Neolewinella xylanilytica]